MRRSLDGNVGENKYGILRCELNKRGENETAIGGKLHSTINPKRWVTRHQ